MFYQTLRNGNINIFGSRLGEGKAMGTYLVVGITKGEDPDGTINKAAAYRWSELLHEFIPVPLAVRSTVHQTVDVSVDD